MSVWLQRVSWEIRGGSSSQQFPFCSRTVLCRTARNTFCISHCLLLLDRTSSTKVTQIFAQETEGGEQAARFMHRFPFPSSPLQGSPNRFFVNRAPGNGESSSSAACSVHLCSFCSSALFHSPYSSCPPPQALSLEASSPQCHEKRDCLLNAAPFGPTDQLPWASTSGILALPESRSFFGSHPTSSVADGRVVLNLAAFESDSPSSCCLTAGSFPS